MASNKILDLHFVLFPLMAQGHMIPLIDTGRMLAQNGVKITIITTPLYASRFKKVLDLEREAGHSIHTIELPFPCQEVGLPQGFENLEMIKNPVDVLKFFNATDLLKDPVEKLFTELLPKPSCIISDVCLPYTWDISTKFNVPRISFHPMSCFCIFTTYKARETKILESVVSKQEAFCIPGYPDPIEFTESDILYGTVLASPDFFFYRVLQTDLASYGALLNTFEELEPKYVEEYKKVRAGKVWCVGPVSLYNKGLAKAERGNKGAISDQDCLKWLDSKEPASVVYVCLGTLCRKQIDEMIELGLGLEASNRPFIWVISKNSKFQDLENWISSDGFEERIKDRGLLIKGWAPQTVILSHPSIGGFLNHGGWNSTLEGLSYGVPLIVWPGSGDQFCNEKLVVNVLKAGVSISGNEPARKDNRVKKDDIKRSLDSLFMEENRREQAKKLRELGKRAVDKEGSSHLNLTLFIQDIMQQI